MTKIQDSTVADIASVTSDETLDLERLGDQSIVTYRSTDANPFNASEPSPLLPNPELSEELPEKLPESEIESQLDLLLETQPLETSELDQQPSDALVSDAHVKDTPSSRGLLAPAALLASIVGLSAFGGFVMGQATNQNQALSVLPAVLTDSSNDATAATAATGTQSEAATGVITHQIGELRAELLRLHAVFAHLVNLAELSNGEFDLESPLLEWKEQSNLERVGLLNRRIAHMSDSSNTLTSIFNTRRIAHDHKISGRPIVEGSRSSGFGYRADPITGTRVEHLGQDYSGPVGEPILALADGIVAFSGKNSGYGNLVELQHPGGFRTRYAHNQANLVSRGARVKKGEPIATLGSTGRSTGPHVHVEVRLDGQAIDPSFFLR